MQRKKDEPKKNIEIEFYWGFDDLEKTKISQQKTKQNKTKLKQFYYYNNNTSIQSILSCAVVLYSFY